MSFGYPHLGNEKEDPWNFLILLYCSLSCSTLSLSLSITKYFIYFLTNFKLVAMKKKIKFVQRKENVKIIKN